MSPGNNDLQASVSQGDTVILSVTRLLWWPQDADDNFKKVAPKIQVKMGFREDRKAALERVGKEMPANLA